MARLFGSIEGAKTTRTATGDELLRARLATWHAAVVVTLDDFGAWSVHVEDADPQVAAAAVALTLARGNLHTDGREYVIPTRSPGRRPGAGWSPYERSPNA